MKLLTRLRLGLSHLNEPRFSHNIKNGIIPLCTCGSEVEPRAHFFLHSHHFNVTQTILLINTEATDKDALKLSDNSRTNLLLFPESKFNNIQNYPTVILSITYILDSKRFDYFLIYCKALPFLMLCQIEHLFHCLTHFETLILLSQISIFSHLILIFCE